jgi:hypothetical protein
VDKSATRIDGREFKRLCRSLRDHPAFRARRRQPCGINLSNLLNNRIDLDDKKLASQAKRFDKAARFHDLVERHAFRPMRQSQLRTEPPTLR